MNERTNEWQRATGRHVPHMLSVFPKVLKNEEEGLTIFPSWGHRENPTLCTPVPSFCFAELRENKVFTTNIVLLCTFLLYQMRVSGGFIFQLWKTKYPRVLTPRGPDFSYKNLKYLLFPVSIKRCPGMVPSQMSVNTCGLWGLPAPSDSFGAGVLEQAVSLAVSLPHTWAVLPWSHCKQISPRSVRRVRRGTGGQWFNTGLRGTAL